MPSENTEFISEEIDMLETSDVGSPMRFRWRGEIYVVTDTVREWQDWGHTAGAHKKNWKNRRHRNYYEIITDKFFHGLIYFDRGVKPSSPRKWIILERYN
jgi:hypothetical protein